MTIMTSEPTNDQSETAQVAYETRRRALEDKVILLCPTMGLWEGRYTIPREKTEVKVDGQEVGKKKGTGVTTPRTVMMTDTWPRHPDGEPWKKKFGRIINRKARLVNALSVPFPIQGVRIVPIDRGSEFFHEMFGLTIGKLRADLRRAREEGRLQDARTLEESITEIIESKPLATDATAIYDAAREEQSIAYDWETLADAFCRNLSVEGGVFDQVKANIEPRKAWDLVESRVPKDPVAMRAKFHVDIIPVELAGTGDSSRVTSATLQAHDEIVRDACRRKVEEAIESVVARPREELANALASLRELIGNDGRVTEKSFRPVRAAIRKIRLFDFVANDTLMGEIDSLEQRLNTTAPGSLDSVTSATNGFTAALDNVLEEVEDEVKMAADREEFGRELRGIQID